MVPIDYGDWPEWIVPGFDLTALIARVAAAIEAEAPDGPVLLASFSLGGEIAYAVAIALTGAGRTIGFFGILDTDISRDEQLSFWLMRVGGAKNDCLGPWH